MGIINVLTAFINFISTFFIVEFLGLSILGEFALFKSYLAIGGLLFSVIPNNYSIFQLQDNKSFEFIFTGFYLTISIVFILYAVFLNLFFFSNINTVIIYLIGITFYWQTFFDIKFQSSGNVKRYFYLILIISILKIITLFVFYYSNHLHSLIDLLWVNIIGQGLVLLVYLFIEKTTFKNIKKSRLSIKKQLNYIGNNFSVFKSYYLHIILKRLRDNFLIIFFGNVLSLETIGLFSLFVKIDSFIFGLGRMIESFLMNRLNFLQLKQKFLKSIFQFTILLQFLYLIVGIVYMKIMLNHFFFIEIFLQSLLVYPYVYFLLARVEILSNYKNRELNFGELIYLSIALVGLLLSFVFGVSSFYIIFITYLIARLGLNLYLILIVKVKINLT